MTIMTVFKLCFNIVLNRFFQCEKQVCLCSCIFLCWVDLAGSIIFLVFGQVLHWFWVWSKTSCSDFVDIFRVLYFSPDPFCVLSLSFCMLCLGRGVGQWLLCLCVCMCRSVGRLWFELGNVYEKYGCVRWVQGFVGSFCSASTVACVSRTSFVFCCWLVYRISFVVVGGAVAGGCRQDGAVVELSLGTLVPTSLSLFSLCFVVCP